MLGNIVPNSLLPCLVLSLVNNTPIGDIGNSKLDNTPTRFHLNAPKEPLCSSLLNFPSHLALHESSYINWAKQIELQHIWTTVPETPGDVVTIANWALEHGYNVRPRGEMHNWAPFTVTGKEGPCSRIIMLDTTKFLTNMNMDTSNGRTAVTAQSGVLVQDLLAFLEIRGYGILGHPAPGDTTVGGVVAIGGHGTGIPLEGQIGNRGTLSHLVLSIDLVVWNAEKGSFQIQTFTRSHPDARALILNLGRLFITKVTLEITPLTHLRCISRVDLSAKTLFANPKNLKFGDTPLTYFLESYGNVESIWFPFTTNPWVKVWSVADKKPLLSRRTFGPYNYVFTDNIPEAVSDVADKLVTGSWSLAPLFGLTQISVIAAALPTTLTLDLWGPSHHLLLYVKPTTLRLTANGYALLLPRSRVQSVLHEFTEFYANLIQDFASADKYPVNGPLEIRVTGLDDDSGMTLRSPALSPIKPIEGRPEYDTSIWIDTLTYPNSPHLPEFMSRVEEYLVHNLTRSGVIVRPEWSKGYGFTDEAGWDNWNFLLNYTPDVYGREDWDYSLNVFKKYDPMEVFTNSFLRRLLQ